MNVSAEVFCGYCGKFIKSPEQDILTHLDKCEKELAERIKNEPHKN